MKCIMKKKEFKILSIDGGGIKGLYSASVLSQLEKRYGCHLADYFDMICGTSTGGLIALALSMRKSAQDITDFYAQKGNQIFPYTNKVSRGYAFFKQLFMGGKYSDATLKKCIEEFIGSTTRMEDAHCLLNIPSFNLTHGKPIVFKYPHTEGGFYRDAKLKMVDVALATSAAPTYFPIATMNYPNLKGQFIDGGVWANNPTLCGLLEALDYFVGEGKEYDSYRILSIASIHQPNGKKINGKTRKSIINWKDKLFESPLDGQNFFADFFTEKMVDYTTSPGNYFRIKSPDFVSPEHLEKIALDVAGKESIEILQSLGCQQGINYVTKPEYKCHLTPFFKEKKHYLTNKKLKHYGELS